MADFLFSKSLRTSVLDYIHRIPFPPPHPFEDEAWKSTNTLSSSAVSELTAVRDQCGTSLGIFNKLQLQLEGQITQLQECHHKLLLEYTSHLARFTRLESAIAPHKTLPPEILSRIFIIGNGTREYCIPRVRHEHESEELFNDRAKNVYPEHVCSLWRQVALNTPALYPSVRVNYGDVGAPGRTIDSKPITEFARQVIARGTRSLDVDLSTLSYEQCHLRLQQLTLPVRERLTHLSVSHSLATQEVLDACVSLLPQLPYLEDFIECIYNDYVYEAIPLKYNLPRDLPVGFWTQMTRLGIAGSDSDAFLTVDTAHYLLQRCPQLESCWLSLGSDAESAAVASPLAASLGGHTAELINLPNLKHLQFHLRKSPVDTSHFLRPLHLPSLWRLRIFTGSLAVVDPQDICELIERGRCNLKAFRFEERSLLEPGLTALLPCLSAVEELALPDTVLPSSIVARIASAEYLPKLQQLEIYMDPDFRVTTAEEIVAIVESRWDNKNGANIQHLQCWHDSLLSPPPVFPVELEQKWESQNRIVRIQHIDESNGYLFA